mgnify:CR=1 FL=1
MDTHIRHARPDDYLELTALYSLPKVIAGTLQTPHPSEARWRSRLAESAESRRVLVALVDGKIVGNLGLHMEPNVRRRHVGGLGMAVDDAFHGRGIGSALMDAALDLADNWINLARLELTVFCDNAPAIALYEKFGFVREGVLKHYAFREGAYEDVITMARFNTPQ